MPAYSTFEILKSKFDYAIEHGTVNMPANEDFLLEDGTKADRARWFAKEMIALRNNKMSYDRN